MRFLYSCRKYDYCIQFVNLPLFPCNVDLRGVANSWRFDKASAHAKTSLNVVMSYAMHVAISRINCSSPSQKWAGEHTGQVAWSTCRSSTF